MLIWLKVQIAQVVILIFISFLDFLLYGVLDEVSLPVNEILISFLKLVLDVNKCINDLIMEIIHLLG